MKIYSLSEEYRRVPRYHQELCYAGYFMKAADRDYYFEFSGIYTIIIYAWRRVVIHFPLTEKP
jgi:hypothetical protein